MACESDNQGPEFILDPAIGTTPCPEDASATSAPCDPQACCNFYNKALEGNGLSFIFSAGGPFSVLSNEGGGQGTCALTPDTQCSAPLHELVAVSGFFNPGALADVICAPNLPPGTYEAKARVELRNANPGTQVVILFRPDCEDADVEYLVMECAAACAPCSVDLGDVAVPLVNKICAAFLNVENTTCTPGFRILVNAGCDGVDEPDIADSPWIQNLQIELVRVTGREVINCGGSPLLEWVAADQVQVNPDCASP